MRSSGLAAAALLGAFVATAAAAFASDPPNALVAAMMRDKEIAGCVAEEAIPARAYVAQAFHLEVVRLSSGERMTAAIAVDACSSRNQHSRVLIYQQTPAGYRRVLDGWAVNSWVAVSSDGTALLPTHETIDTIAESLYVWNGTAYVWSPFRSTLYSLPLEMRRPYETPVHFAPGTFGTTLSGTVATNFGYTYAVDARAGQRMTVALTHYSGNRPWVSISYGERDVASLAGTPSWSGTLKWTGRYLIDVKGSNDKDAAALSPYTLRLEIR